MRIPSREGCGGALLCALIALHQIGCVSQETENGSTVTEPREQTAISFDGVRIAYGIVGTAEPTLVFVHGWSCDRSYWDAQVRPFSESFRVVTVDLAGHGESGVGRRAWTMASYGADVAAVVTQLDLDRVILIGHSMGGDVVVSAARLLGDRVIGMIWVDDYSQLGTVRTADQVTAVLGRFREEFADSTYAHVRRTYFSPTADPELVERVARDMAAAPAGIALASLESSITNDRVVPGVLDKLNLPVVSLNPAGSNPDVEALERHGVEVVLVPDVGHFMMMEDPVGFNAILLDVVQDMAAGVG